MLVIDGLASSIQPPSQPSASTAIGKPLVAICMVADSPPLPTSTQPDATACIRCTRLGKVMISASMPSGFNSSGIRNIAFVVVVKAVPNFTLRSVWPSDVLATKAGAASAAAASK